MNNLDFIADRVAELDALLTYIVASARASESWPDFQKKLNDDLGQVVLTTHVDVEKWLADQKGYVALIRPRLEGGISEVSPDYYRDDTGLPVVAPTEADLRAQINTDVLEIVRIIKLENNENKEN